MDRPNIWVVLSLEVKKKDLGLEVNRRSSNFHRCRLSKLSIR